MIAPFALALTQDERRVVLLGHREAAFLLAAQGANIPAKFVPLVEQFLRGQDNRQEERPPHVAEADTSLPPTDTADPILTMRKRRGRGRPRLSDGFGGE